MPSLLPVLSCFWIQWPLILLTFFLISRGDSATTCGEHFQQLNGEWCYGIFNERSKWEEARVSCRLHRAFMLNFQESFSEQDMRLLLERAGDYDLTPPSDQIWIGLKKTANYFQWLDWKPQPFRKSIDSNPHWLSWGQNEPSSTERHCVSLGQDGTLRTNFCNSTLPYVCIHQPVKTSLTPVPFCQDGWLSHDWLPGSCLLVQPASPWDQASKVCSDKDGHLLNDKTYEDLKQKSITLDPEGEGMWLLQVLSKKRAADDCFTSLFGRKPCESSYKFVCERYVPSDVSVQASIYKKLRPLDDTVVWIDESTSVSLSCRVKINGQPVRPSTSDDGIQYFWLKNGVYMGNPRRTMIPQTWKFLSEPTSSQHTVQVAGTYSCHVNIPWLRTNRVSNQVSLFVHGFQSFILDIDLTLFQEIRPPDLELLSMNENRIRFNRTFYDLFDSLVVEPSGITFQDYWWMIQSIRLKNENSIKKDSKLHIKALVSIRSNGIVDWNRTLFERKGKKVALSIPFEVTDLKVVVVDRCPNETIIFNSSSYTWEMKEGDSKVFSNPVCYSDKPPYEKLHRMCHSSYEEAAKWDKFDYGSCLTDQRKKELLESSCAPNFDPVDNVTCTRKYNSNVQMLPWTRANETCWQQSAQLGLPMQSALNSTTAGVWLDMKSNGELMYKIVRTQGTIKFQKVSHSCPLYQFANNQDRYRYINCSQQQSFVCERPQYMNILAEVPWCSQGWYGSDLPMVRGECYLFHLAHDSNFTQAVQQCDSAGGHLAVADERFGEKLATGTIRMLRQEHTLQPESTVKFWVRKTGQSHTAGTLQECCGENTVFRWDQVDPSAMLGFICHKKSLNSKFYRISRVTLTKQEQMLPSGGIQLKLICEGRKVHPNSMVRWFSNGDLINQLNGQLINITRTLPESNVIAAWVMNSPSDEGQYQCEIGGSDSIPTIRSNNVLVRTTGNDSVVVHLEIEHENMPRVLDKVFECYTQFLKKGVQEIRLFPSASTNDMFVRVHNQSGYTAWNKFDTCLSAMKTSIGSIRYKSADICPEATTRVGSNILEWPSSPLGHKTLSSQPCVTDNGSYIMRECKGDYIRGAEWEPVEESCHPNNDTLSQSLHILAESNVVDQTVSRTSSELLNLTRTSTRLKPIDLFYISKTMNKMASVDNVPQQVLEDTAETIDFLLQENRLNGSRSSKLRITRAFDQILENVQIEDNRSLELNLESLSIHSYVPSQVPIVGISADSGQTTFNSSRIRPLHNVDQLHYNSTDAAILLPQNLISFQEPNSRVTFVVYENSQLFPDNEDLSAKRKFRVNSRVVSANVPQSTRKLDPPVQLIFKFTKPVASMDHASCVFWDFQLVDGSGDWSDEGCWIAEFSPERVTCNCSHLTHFAVLMDMYGQDHLPDEVHRIVLDVITYIGCALSIVGLIMTILTFALFKKWRKKDGNKVLCNLSVALLMLLVVFLSGIERVDEPFMCTVAAIFLHYFLLAAFCWMLVEAILQYLLFVRVLDTYIPRFIIKAMAFAWGSPVLIIIIVLCIDPDLYHGGDEYCWMSLNAMYYALLLPMAIMMAANVGVFIRVLKGITCDRKNTLRTNQSKRRLAMVQLQAAAWIFILLGLTWSSGFMAIAGARLFFQYMFCVCNSLQGMCIFIFMVVRDRNAKDLWYSFVTKTPMSNAPLIMSSVKSSSSSGPKHNEKNYRY